MEPLSKRSRIIAAQDTSAIDLPETVYTFSGGYDRIVHTTTPVTDDSRLFSFEILPSISGELKLNECELVTKWKLLKADNSTIGETDQVSICQGFGVTAFDSCQIKIGGAPYCPEFQECSDHYNFLRLLYGHSERERLTTLKSVG